MKDTLPITPAAAALAAKTDPRLAAFLPEQVDADAHIADTLIMERCPSFVGHWSWPAVRPALYRMLGYGKARAMADIIARLDSGHACFDHLEATLGLALTVRFPERLPTTGRSVIICNHPTGLADGAAMWGGVKQVRRDIQIFANADACRVNPAFADIIIPVEWVSDKRAPAKTRETLRRASEAFRAEQCVVMFPSGRLARKTNGRLIDKPWFTTGVSLARKNNAPVTPVHLKARNSWLYYTLAGLSQELRDITLFHELLNKQGDPFELTFGPPISPADLTGDPQTVTDALKQYVETVLPHDPHRPFADFLASMP